MKLPRVSILVPLRREEAVAARLLEALQAMDYPPALLDIKLVLEADDAITRAAIDRAALPPTIEVVTVPADALQTKPRAMNYALPFCRGDIVGVYDAEDRPDPGQIRAVVAPPAVGAAGGRLRAGLPRLLQRRGQLARPAASRSNTRSGSGWCCSGCSGSGCRSRSAAPASSSAAACSSAIGGWDAHNVTEDADLGMRLARFGYRCEMIASTTWEEANCRVLAVDHASGRAGSRAMR